MTPQEIVLFLQARRFPLRDEKRLQELLGDEFVNAGISYDREPRLGAGDVIDFLVGSVGIEIKLRGQQKREIYRQCERYCRHERVGSLVLATNISMGWPKEILGKPQFYVNLSRAWL